MKLYFSIDLESWAYPNHPQYLKLDSSARKEKDNGFVLESINEILDLLAEYNQKITFFCIAEMFEWYPQAFWRIKNAGHEIAYHTHRHTLITSSGIMKKEISASGDFLKEFKPVGFRAPEIYLPQEAIRPLVETGFRYSSSVYGSYNDVFYCEEENFSEFPISSLHASNEQRIMDYPRSMNWRMFKEIPFGSGYFLAFFPLDIIEKFIEKYFKAGKPVFMFAHNWQIVKPKGASFPDFWHKLNPLYLPYTMGIGDKIKTILKKYRLGRMDELI